MTYGDWTEQRVTRATALGGQPDFTFAAHMVTKGSGHREIGDTIVWLGRRLLVISTKSRDPHAGITDGPDDAASWLDKNIAKACSQIDGVVQTLQRAEPGEIELTSEEDMTKALSFGWRYDSAAAAADLFSQWEANPTAAAERVKSFEELQGQILEAASRFVVEQPRSFVASEDLLTTLEDDDYPRIDQIAEAV